LKTLRPSIAACDAGFWEIAVGLAQQRKTGKRTEKSIETETGFKMLPRRVGAEPEQALFCRQQESLRETGTMNPASSPGKSLRQPLAENSKKDAAKLTQ
jgi:hypothetical protein